MGATNSKQSIEHFSKDEVAELVTSYGEKFHVYGNIIKENGIDGELLTSLSEEELLETLDELEITSRLHRRKFVNEFRGGTPSGSTIITSGSGTASISSSDCDVMDEFNAKFVKQSEENKSLLKSMVLLKNNQKKRTSIMAPPKGTAAIVLTDVESSTMLWERNPKAMRAALELHDQLIRKHCQKYLGYEIDTEGDAFFLAFHEALDAYGFALDFQNALNEADWSPEFLALPYCSDDVTGRRGLRVRVTIHFGDVETRKNSVSGRTEYCGPAMEVARGLESMTRGGQILTTYETWNGVMHLHGQLNSPHIANLGTHTIGKSQSRSGLLRTRILEVAPANLKTLSSPDMHGSDSSLDIATSSDMRPKRTSLLA